MEFYDKNVGPNNVKTPTSFKIGITLFLVGGLASVTLGFKYPTMLNMGVVVLAIGAAVMFGSILSGLWRKFFPQHDDSLPERFNPFGES